MSWDPPKCRAPWAAGTVLFLLLATGCATNRYQPPRPGDTIRGVSSWYGEKFHGRLTASGVVYDMHGLTAAHRELPLGTVIDVRNLENGRQVRVEVNDRGPFIRGRILDLSFGAAKEVGMDKAGLAKVEIRIVSVGRGQSGPISTHKYAVQAGAFREKANALNTQKRLEADYPEVSLETTGDFYRVRVGIFRKRREAEDITKRLKRAGFDAYVVALP